MYFRQKNLLLLVLAKLLHRRENAANQLRNVERYAVKENKRHNSKRRYARFM